MRSRTIIFLAILWIIGAAFAASKLSAATPNFDLTGNTGRYCDCPDVRADLAALNARVDRIESDVQAMTAKINEAVQKMTIMQQSQWTTLEEQREMARELRSRSTAPVTSYASQLVSQPMQTVQPYVGTWPTTQAQFATYQNAAGQLPRTMVGNQIVEASPAYQYTDAQGRTWTDYPVSISSQPVAEFPVSMGGYSSYQRPVTYSAPSRGFSICGPGGCR